MKMNRIFLNGIMAVGLSLILQMNAYATQPFKEEKSPEREETSARTRTFDPKRIKTSAVQQIPSTDHVTYHVRHEELFLGEAQRKADFITYAIYEPNDMIELTKENILSQEGLVRLDYLAYRIYNFYRPNHSNVYIIDTLKINQHYNIIYCHLYNIYLRSLNQSTPSHKSVAINLQNNYLENYLSHINHLMNQWH